MPPWGPYPMAACTESHIGCRLGQELFTLYAATGAHGAMDWDQKGFMPMWQWHQLLSGSLL